MDTALTLDTVLDALYDSELNFRIIADWDLGFLVQLGDGDAEAYVRTSAEAAAWFDRQARLLRPESKYSTGREPAPIEMIPSVTDK